jgi:hypothetical protein
MSKTSLDELQTQLRDLIEKAHKQNVNLSDLKSIQKRSRLFTIGNKYKACLTILILAVFYGHFEDYFCTKTVRTSFLSNLLKGSELFFLVLDIKAKSSGQSVSKA